MRVVPGTIAVDVRCRNVDGHVLDEGLCGEWRDIVDVVVVVVDGQLGVDVRW